MKKAIIAVLSILAAAAHCYGQDSLWPRTYEFGVYNNFDLRNSSVNAISAHRVLNDGFDLLIPPDFNPVAGGIAKGLFSFSSTYLTMLWSHEMGHFIRARQVGGSFDIHNFNLPVPYTTADLPADISLVDEAIFVTAGFEVNYLNIRTIQSQFIQQNGIGNGDLALSFANRLMYTIYSTLIVPIDPREENVWIETAGDPVHFILPVFENYSSNQVFMPDGSVNPELVGFYNEALIFAMAFHLLDPQFYREIGASFGDGNRIRRPVFLAGDHENGWTYGTLFNVSPLGYELYMQNYIHLNGRQFGLYLKYGRPFHNIGIGLSLNDAIAYKNLRSDIALELWQQDLFGNGISAEISSQLKVSEHFGISFNLGYKTEGYLLGKQLDQGLNLGMGICLYNDGR